MTDVPGDAQSQPQDAVISGGSSGIGWACVTQYVGAGGRVVIGDLKEPTDARWSTMLDLVRFVRTDVTSAEACEDLVAEAVDFCGRVPDVAVTAAGIASAGRRRDPSEVSFGEARAPRSFESRAGYVVQLRPDVLDRLLDVNLRGTFNLVRAFGRAALEVGAKAAIVTVSSGAGSIPLRGGAAYCVSKAGVEMLTKVMALEVAGDGIRVNAISPGYVETPMTAAVRGYDEVVQALLADTPMGRFGTAEEIADGIIFLGSPRSSYMTGQVLHVSGGQFVG